MKRLSANIDSLFADISGDQDRIRVNFRAHQVRSRYKSALEAVYKDKAPLFLQHTNNVYIMNKKEVRTLIAYVDESIFAAELNAQRELIKLKLLELFGEKVEKFEILVSRGPYKNNHPYEEELKECSRSCKPLPLDSQEKRYVNEISSIVENQPLKKSLESAMTASMGLNKAEMKKHY